MILDTTALKDMEHAMTNGKKIITFAFCFMLLAALFLLIADSAYASTTSGLEYETALESFANSITGPVAFFVSIIAMAAAGFGIVFGGELTGWIKIACGIICIVGFIVFSSNIFSTLYSGVNTTLIM